MPRTTETAVNTRNIRLMDQVRRLKRLFELKLAGMENMENLLLRRIEMIDRENFDEFDKIRGRTDDFESEMKEIDYEIAIIESSLEHETELLNPAAENHLAALMRDIRAKAGRNSDLLSALAAQLSELKSRDGR